MDKKKVKELIKKGMLYQSKSSHVSSYKEKAKNCFEEALNELQKSDWVSVEDKLPPYNENVEVCSKVEPTVVWIDSRDKYIDVGNSFRYNKLYGNIITHWKPINKLED